MPRQSKSVVFSANRGYALSSSRSLLIQYFISSGWAVTLATADDEESRYLLHTGAHLEPVNFHRGGFSPWTDLKAYQRLRTIYKKWRPRLIHSFHAKPNILCALAARKALGNSVKVVNSVTGLGHAFISSGITAGLAGTGYRLAKDCTDMTIFQNRDDLALFLAKRWVDKERANLIPGSGVDVKRFPLIDRRGRGNKPPVVVMLGRLLRQKGIPEFVETARRIRSIWPQVEFLLAGEEDPKHPDSVSAQWIEEQGWVSYLGRLSDVLPLLTKADVLLFPSYYREGVPRAVLEAAATGLPAIGFDVPGVREAVRDGVTGFLVPEKELDVLSQKVSELLHNKEKRLAMGWAARQLVEEAFDIRIIQEQYIKTYRELNIQI